ncbi:MULTISPECIES: xanthine dehydrogenase family protein molybdopterin-binding subunit [unclassified Geodermatophilus]
MTDPRIRAQLRYPVDLTVPGMWHARVVRSAYASARVTDVDTSMVPEGVVVLTPADVEGLGRYGAQIRDQHILAGTARHIGDPVAVVIAPDEASARAAAALVDVSYEELPAVFDEREALRPGTPLVHETIPVSSSDSAYFGMRPLEGTNICHRFRIRTNGIPQGEPYSADPEPDDAAEGFSAAEVIVDETFYMPAVQHVPMEPHACIATWTDGRLELTTGTQTPFNMRQDLAVLFGVPESDVRVVVPPMGGSFGAKTFVRTEAIAAAAAQRVNRPVRLVLDRDEEFVTITRHAATVRIRLGATRDGRFVAKRVWCWVNTGAYADCGPGVAMKMGYAGVGPYRFDAVAVDSYCIYTNLPPAGAYRGYGATQSVWASERVTDLMAERLGMDPVELRRRNVLVDGDVYCTGETMHDVHFEELLDDAARAVDWRPGGPNPGKGIAVMLKGMQTPSKAEVGIRRVGPDRYEVLSATTEMGQGSARAIAQLAAELLGVEADQVDVPPPDTDRVPYDTRTTSSRSTHMMSRALEAAVADLKDNGTDHGHGRIANEGGLDLDTGQGVASSHWHQGAASAQVEVDEETGVLTLRRLHASSYAGRVVNKAAAELQQEGSMIMALGTTLFEEMTFDEGQVVGPNLSDYNIPSALDCSPITQTILELEGAEVHGLGETALPPVPPAIGNALASHGYSPTRLPLTPERVLACAKEPA